MEPETNHSTERNHLNPQNSNWFRPELLGSHNPRSKIQDLAGLIFLWGICFFWCQYCGVQHKQYFQRHNGPRPFKGALLSLNPQPLLKLHLRRNTMSLILVKTTFFGTAYELSHRHVMSKPLSTCDKVGIFDIKRQFSSTAKTEDSRIKKTSKSWTFFCLVWFSRGQKNM